MSKHDFYINLTDAKGRENMFSEVTDVYDFIKLKLTALELLITQWNGCHEQEKCKFPYMCVEDYELHRIFIESNNKIISFGFGLKIKAKPDKIDAFILIIKDNSDNKKTKKLEISAKHISDAIAILNQVEKDKTELYNDIVFDDLENIPSEEGKHLFEYFLFEEPAYIRYDYDKQAAKNEKAIVHPQYHFDINFSKDYSYKLGLPKSIDEKELRNIFLSKDFCRMISLKKNRINRGTRSLRNNNLKFLKKSRGKY